MTKAIKLQIQAAIEHLKSAVKCVDANEPVGVRVKLTRAGDCVEQAKSELEEETKL